MSKVTDSQKDEIEQGAVLESRRKWEKPAVVVIVALALY